MNTVSFKRLVLGLVAVSVAGSLLGCPLLKKKGDAGADDDESNLATLLADAATVKVGGTGAKNEGAVLRYANEEKLDEAAIIGKDGIVVRNFPGNGPVVATLNKGTLVTKVAKYFSTAVLITFDEPGTGDKLLGWVSPSAFGAMGTVAPVATMAKPVTKTDSGASVVPVPVPVIVDAGSPSTPKDAGAAPAVVDAGGGSGGSGKLPQPPRGSAGVAPVNGQCPDGWFVVQSLCRRLCAADAECPRGTFCVAKSGKKVCTSDK